MRPPKAYLKKDVRQEDASIIFLFEAVNYKVKSTSKLLQVLRDLLYVLFSVKNVTVAKFELAFT